MTNTIKHRGSFFPDQSISALYAMAGDDCSLHFDMEQLTDSQQADHEANVVLTALLQVALIGISKASDHIALYSAFSEEPWRSTLNAYLRLFEKLGLDGVPTEHLQFHHRDTYYAEVAAQLPDVEMINLYMTSHSNRGLHQNDQALTVSQNVNSKMHFARNSASFQIPTPDTLLCSKADLGSPAVADFFSTHGNCMIKVQGLAGARNVASVRSVAESIDCVAQYKDTMEVLLQNKLDSRYTEMTVDLRITDTTVQVANVRKILFSDGLWVGNLIGDQVGLTPAQTAVLLRVGEYAREQGYSSELGVNCGIDFFVDGDDVQVIEINARWTGGLFPAQMIKRLDIGQLDVVAFFDLVSKPRLSDYTEFVAENLYDGELGPRDFTMIPLGFSPFCQPMDGREMVYTWNMVVGDFEAFNREKLKILGTDELTTAGVMSINPT